MEKTRIQTRIQHSFKCMEKKHADKCMKKTRIQMYDKNKHIFV